MTVEMKPPLHTSTAVDSFGFEPIKSGMRGNIHVQFRDKAGNLTSRGYYKSAQRSIFLGLEASMKPGAFIHQNLKEHFEWVSLDVVEDLTDTEPFDDTGLPATFCIPADCPNTVEAINACYDAQRVKPMKEGLFE